MKEPAAVTPEFSRPVPADSVGPQPLLRRIEAEDFALAWGVISI